MDKQAKLQFSTSETGIVNLGTQEELGILPTQLLIDNQPYLLSRDESDNFILFSAICPHQGGLVALGEHAFVCHKHHWQFSKKNGACLNAPKHKLSTYAVHIEDGHLVAELQSSKNVTTLTNHATAKGMDFSLRLISHACLEISSTFGSLLTDPWIDGPAFLGAWIQYPQSPVKVRELLPKAICITHEHSDHFHKQTLLHFDRNTPIFFPDFPNQRLTKEIKNLGFNCSTPMPFGERHQAFENVWLTFFEPHSYWNDAIVLIEIGDFKLLNLNDAGLNSRIAREVGVVDMIACGFSPAASGYPQTWMHLTLEQKRSIMSRAKKGSLEMCKEALSLYGSKRFLPFASHFALWHPSQQQYAMEMQKNTLDDVINFFDKSEVQVIDLMPGERWQASSNQFERIWRDRSRLYQRETVLRTLKRSFQSEIFEKFHPQDIQLSATRVIQYFQGLAKLPEMVYCDDLIFSIEAANTDFSEIYFKINLQIKDGKLTELEQAISQPELLIQVPRNILNSIIIDKLSWDEAHIGYWCRFSRSPDLFHSGFWRLLQAPNFAFNQSLPLAWESVITEETCISEILEKGGDLADRVLRRYGLYCLGCKRSTAEPLRIGCESHGLNGEAIVRLIKELNATFATTEHSNT